MNAKVLKPLGDPATVRPSTDRRGFSMADPIADHPTDSGKTATVLWIPVKDSGTRCDVYVRVTELPPVIVPDVIWANAGRVTEKLLRQL